MPFVQYSTYANIVVDNSDPALYQKCLKCLERIASLPSGKPLLNDINATGKRLEIKPLNGDVGSSCGPADDNAFILLAQAKKTASGLTIKNELTMAMGRSKLTVEAIATALATGLAPATYISAKNVVRPGTAPGPVNDYIKKIQGLLAGQVQAQDNPLHVGVRRVLRAWLTPGRGSNADIEINVERPTQCWTDGQNKMRYPTICLAHEMVHAWRYMTGKYLGYHEEYPRHEYIEEVIATGLPPYNFEKYSENLFRSQWPDEMELRTAY